MKRIGILLLVLMLVLAGCQATVDETTRGPVRITSVLANQLRVLGASTHVGAVTMDSTLAVGGAATVTGATALNGGLTMDTNKFTVADTSGNTVIAGTLAANGGITVDTSNFTVNGTTGAVASASSIAAGTALSGQTVASTGTTTVGTSLLMTPATGITVTNGMTLTPLGSYQPLTAAGSVAFGAITAGTAGAMLYLTNNSAQTITMTDTGTLMLSGNLALGQYDTVLLLSDGTNWRQVATTNN